MAGIPDAGVALIKKFEGLRLEAYPDPLSGGKPYTIGYGSTRTKSGGAFAIGDKISKEEATELLIQQIERDYLPPLEDIPNWSTFNDDQRGAILSFAYNLGARFYGANNFETITRVLREKQWDQIEAALVLYRNRGTSVERGLLRRRLSEAELFLKGVPGEYLSPPGQQFLSGILEAPQQYFDAQADTFEPGERIVSVTRPFMRGDDIAIAQKTLVRKGYDIDADGIFGPASRAAFEDFQEKNDLPVDGILEDTTWAKLLAPEPDLSLELETELASNLDNLDLDLGLETEAEPELVLGLEPLEPDLDLDLDLDLGLDPAAELDPVTESAPAADSNTDLANTIAELPDSGVKLIKTYEFGDTPPEDGADELLLEKIAQVLPPQKKIPNWSTFSDSQRGALVSFAYDVDTNFYGADGFEAMTHVLKGSQWDQLEATLITYPAPDSSAESGLKRRLMEAELFLKEVPGESLSPPGQQFLSGVLETPQQYFDAQGETFEAGQRVVSVTRPFMRGDDIATAQKALVKQGYDIDTDGIFGPASKTALEDFQQKNGLSANGILDATTWENLLVAEPVTLEPVTPEPDLDTLPVIPIGEPTPGEPGVTPETPPADLSPAKWICTLQKDTVLKLRPDDANQLSDAEKQIGSVGATYGLQSYAYADPVLGDFNGHLKVALQNETINGFNTWFVKGDAVQITSAEGDVVYPWEEQQATFVLKVFRNTVFKRLPMQSSELTEAEKVEVSKDTELELHSYAYQDTHGDFSNHIRVALKRQEDYLNGLSQWYVYDKHAYVEYDEGIVYPPAPLLKVTQDTIIKRRPVQSSDLPKDQKYIIPEGRAFILDSWAHTDEQGRAFNRHIKFTIKLETEFIEKISTWYVYDQHAQVIWNDKVLYPPFRGNPFKLPGNETTFYTGQPIIKDGNFTWGEATKNGTRLPANAEIVNNIINLAQELQKARNLIGKPFVINSWYRTPEANSAVGGARNSLHLQGSAVDMYVPGYSVRQVANALMSSWPGGILIYSTHLHLDTGRKQVIFL